MFMLHRLSSKLTKLGVEKISVSRVEMQILRYQEYNRRLCSCDRTAASPMSNKEV